MGLFRAWMMACLGALALGAEGVGGDWNAEVQGKDAQVIALTMHLEEEGGVLTGTLRDSEGEHAISSGTSEGDEICFSVIRDRDGYQVIERFRGTLEEDVIHFEVSVEDQHCKGRARAAFEAKRLS